MHKFVDFLKKIAGIGLSVTPIVSAFLPFGIGAVVQRIVALVGEAEAKFPARGSGESKSAYVGDILATEVPQILAGIQGFGIGGPVQSWDHQGVGDALSVIRDGVVKLLTATRHFQTTNPVPTNTAPVTQ